MKEVALRFLGEIFVESELKWQEAISVTIKQGRRAVVLRVSSWLCQLTAGFSHDFFTVRVETREREDYCAAKISKRKIF